MPGQTSFIGNKYLGLYMDKYGIHVCLYVYLCTYICMCHSVCMHVFMYASGVDLEEWL